MAQMKKKTKKNIVIISSIALLIVGIPVLSYFNPVENSDFMVPFIITVILYLVPVFILVDIFMRRIR